MIKNKLKIIGLDVSSKAISNEKKDLILSSDILAGGKRHLDLFKEYTGTKLPITGHISNLLSGIKDYMAEGLNIVVLASGDPLLFGIGNTIIKEFGLDSVDVYPGISSVQAALSRLGIETNNVLTINRHSDNKDPLSGIAYYDVSVILTSEINTPSDIIRELTDRFPWASGWIGHICECMGTDDEHVRSGNLDKLSSISFFKTPNLLVIQNPYPIKPYSGSPCFGKQDIEYEHDSNMITHPEVRAVTLSKLKLTKSEVMWDIGAGSGSVGIEAALLNPLLKVYCIDKNEQRMARVINNKETHNAYNVVPVIGNAIDVCPSLPLPDRIFFGGGGKDLYALLSFGRQALRKNGVMVINTVTLEAFEAARSFCMSEANEYDFVEINVSRQHSLAGYHILKPENPVSIFTVNK